MAGPRPSGLFRAIVTRRPTQDQSGGVVLRVSAALIVRDEEAHLPACLASLADEVDEIVVVDTGSRDATREIAKNYSAEIFDRPWTGDFSAARNHALDNATGDWILYIDADERLVVPYRGALREQIQKPDAVGLSVRFRPRVNFTPYREIRLFRRDPRIRFEGVIHESPHRGIQDVARTDGLTIVEADVGIDHFGYDGNMTLKYHRNLPLLEAAVKARPERVFLWTDLSEALTGLGRDEEAKIACRRAIEAAKAASHDPKQQADAVQAWRRLIWLSAAEPGQALDLAQSAAALYPDNYSIRLDLARALFKVGEVAQVLAIVRNLAAIDANSINDPRTAYDKRIFGEWAFDLMGAAHARLGDKVAAAAAFARASELAPDVPAYKIKAHAFAEDNSVR